MTAATQIRTFEDAKAAFPHVLDDGWLWPEGSQLAPDLILWAKSPCKRLLVVEVQIDDLAQHFAFVDDDLIEQWGDQSAEQAKQAEERAREFISEYRDN